MDDGVVFGGDTGELLLSALYWDFFVRMETSSSGMVDEALRFRMMGCYKRWSRRKVCKILFY